MDTLCRHINTSRASVVIIFLLLQTEGSLATRCLVHATGRYIYRYCDDCCDSGRNRRCCTNTADVNDSSVAVVGVVFGCLIGLLILGSGCMYVYKCCVGSGKPSSVPPPGLTNPHPHSITTDHTEVCEHHLDPPAYTPPGSPPPYSRDGPTAPPCRTHVSPSSPWTSQDMSVIAPSYSPPPPYTASPHPTQTPHPSQHRHDRGSGIQVLPYVYFDSIFYHDFSRPDI
ncbi:uncharacterized protein LOC124144476 isoform X1 [Haliotis rufescens]|uniref:uncharacterized protein LOC124144476 isoform X1 n=1 Tax=Haliotis rufescens TaxID=6454 RepID=UPI00201F88D9|nr:uncharacterized protein LOC124144476 isoform X1 [Haliotis rufescens]